VQTETSGPGAESLRPVSPHGLIRGTVASESGSSGGPRSAAVRELLNRALALSPAERPALLHSACSQDPGLRAEVEALLRAADGSPPANEHPAESDLTRTGAPGPSQPLLSGARLSHYEIVEKIGEGGMGAVYKAVDVNLARPVALKVISRQDITALDRKRFAREAKAASALNHPNIVTIYEYNSAAGVDFIAMEFIEGATLETLLSRRAADSTLGTPELPALIDYARQTASALAKAHAAGIVHRDLKTGNIMVTPDGHVKVLDFGLAKRQASESSDPDAPGPDTHLTFVGTVMGTPAYMSPEQAVGENADWRSDIFSFGVILYEIVCGVRPFQGANTIATLKQIVHADPRPVREIRADVPDAVADLIGACLEKDRDARLQTLAGALADTAGAVSVTRPTPARPKPAGLLRPRWVWGVVAAAAVAAAAWAASPRIWQLMTPAVTVAEPRTAFEHERFGSALLTRYDRKGNVDGAIESLQRSISLDPEYAPAYAALAEAFLQKHTASPDVQWIRQAEDAARRAVDLSPDLARARVALARVHLANGRTDDAAAELMHAERMNPKGPDAPYWQGVLRYGAGDAAGAEDALGRAASLDTTDWRAPARLGEILVRQGKFQEATSALQKARDLTPDNAIVHRMMAAAAQGLGDFDSAASHLQDAIAVDPTAPVYNNLGTLRFFQGRYADAVPAFEKAVDMRAGSYLYWANLGDAYRWAPGRRDKAPDAYANAIRLAQAEIEKKPGDADLNSRLAMYSAKQGDAGAARAYLAQLPSSGRTGAVEFRSAVSWEILGEREHAMRALSAALSAGYPVSEVANEPELTSLRATREYQTLIASYDRTSEATEPRR
jgi:eukaryotic-like serine/threonine-protein kinase